MALPSKNRLKKKKDFDLVFKKGRTLKGDLLFLKTLPNGSQDVRVGIMVSSKLIKKAVTRNKIKRTINEAFRSSFSLIRGGIDIVIIIKKNAEEENLREELLEMLDRLNIIK